MITLLAYENKSQGKEMSANERPFSAWM